MVKSINNNNNNNNNKKLKKQWNKKRKSKKQYKKNLSIKKLKQLRNRPKPKKKEINLNKPENIINLSLINSLHKPQIDLELLKKNNDNFENDASPKMKENNNNKNKKENVSQPISISNLPTIYKPGSQINLPQQINVRHWKSIQNQHLSKLQEFNPKTVESFQHSMYFKKEKAKMKEIENKLRDEIRGDKQLEKMKKQQRDEMRKENMMRGLVVKPIRNMHKLKKFTKKQWKSVMKAHVEIHNPRNALRGSFISRQ